MVQIGWYRLPNKLSITRAPGARAAGSGHGPFIPATPSVLLTKQLLDGTLQTRGAMPCVGLFTLDQFITELGDLDIAAGIA